MTKKITMVLLAAFGLLTLNACDEETLLNPKLDPGTYQSGCVAQDSSSFTLQLEVNDDDESMETKTNYSASTDCTGVSTTTADNQFSAIPYSNIPIGIRASYFQKEDGGQPEFTPFKISGDKVYIGESVSQLGEAKETFSAFISDPEGEAFMTLTKQ